MIYRLTNLELQLPTIVSDSPLIHFINSSSVEEKSYRINLGEYSCACPNWIEDRSEFPFNDIRRACKHISSLMQFFPLGWILPVPAERYRLAYVLIDGYQYCLAHAQSTSWIDVKVKNRVGGIYDYGYNFEEKRWSYTTTPRHSKCLRPMILKWVTSNDPAQWTVER